MSKKEISNEFRRGRLAIYQNQSAVSWDTMRRLKQYCYKCPLYDEVLDGCKNFLLPHNCEIALERNRQEIRRLKQYCYKCNLYDPLMDGCKDFILPNNCKIARGMDEQGESDN